MYSRKAKAAASGEAVQGAERGNENNIQSRPAADNRPVGADQCSLRFWDFRCVFLIITISMGLKSHRASSKANL